MQAWRKASSSSSRSPSAAKAASADASRRDANCSRSCLSVHPHVDLHCKRPLIWHSAEPSPARPIFPAPLAALSIMSQPTSSTSRLGLLQSQELSHVEKKGISLEIGPRFLKETALATPLALMRFPSQPSEHRDERSWTPNEVGGPRTRPEEPGMRITGRCALRDGSASSRSMPTGIRSIEAGRSERNPGPGQVLRFPPGSVTGARRRFDFNRTLHPHTDLSMREVGSGPDDLEGPLLTIVLDLEP